MNKKDEEIQRKLLELETVVLKESAPPPSLPAASQPGTRLSGATTGRADAPTTSVNQDLCYFLGIGLIFTGILMFFNHVKVGTGFLAALGMGGAGIGLLMIPFMVGLGWLMYDSKNKWAWVLTAATCAVLIFSVLSSIVMSFPTLSLIGLVMLLLPFAAGGALLLKGVGGPKALKDKLNAKE